jgi:hypothetical protein
VGGPQAKLIACLPALEETGISFPFLNSDNSSARLLIATTSAYRETT